MEKERTRNRKAAEKGSKEKGMRRGGKFR